LRIRLDQSAGPDDDLFHSLGTFEFSAGAAAIVLSASGVEGCVHADAVQLLEAKD